MDVLTAAYRPLIAYADAVDDDEGWRPTALPGWCVRDLLLHLLGDCQRALVALHTPSSDPDTDEVSYWTEWEPGTQGARDGLRGTRIQASAWSSVRGPAGLYVETARAVLEAVRCADPAAVVQTQGRRLTVASLVRTLAIEAGVHHLDLRLPTGPHPSVLALAAEVCDALAGAPSGLAPERWVLLATGRANASPEERAALGALAEELPLFG